MSTPSPPERLFDAASERVPGSSQHLHRLVQEWQLLADLCFSDCSLWLPVPSDAPASEAARESAGSTAADAGRAAASRLSCVAHVRPNTAPTAHPEELVGAAPPQQALDVLRQAWHEGAQGRERGITWHSRLPVRQVAEPVRYQGRVVGALLREANISKPWVPSALETAYLGCAVDLLHMVSEGEFPPPPAVSTPARAATHLMRAGDGLLRLHPNGRISFASPNATSALHRCGYRDSVPGQPLDSILAGVWPDPRGGEHATALLTRVFDGSASATSELELDGATLAFRAFPLRPGGAQAGALVLLRDITEVRDRDRALLSKDATIREIHHRVKNNLQTVAALLRLQSRRSSSGEAKEALAESVRRVTSIAMVHETLSTSVQERVELDEVVDKVLPMLAEVSAAESTVLPRRRGSFGAVSARLATPLIMVISELVQNAVEHAHPDGAAGVVLLRISHSGDLMLVDVVDDGVGMAPDWDRAASTSLGLQIVRTLVESELHGSIEFAPDRDPAGGERPDEDGPEEDGPDGASPEDGNESSEAVSGARLSGLRARLRLPAAVLLGRQCGADWQ